MVDEFVERDAVDVVALAAETADQTIAAGVGGVCRRALERLPGVFDAMDRVAGDDQPADDADGQQRDRDDGDRPPRSGDRRLGECAAVLERGCKGDDDADGERSDQGTGDRDVQRARIDFSVLVVAGHVADGAAHFQHGRRRRGDADRDGHEQRERADASGQQDEDERDHDRRRIQRAAAEAEQRKLGQQHGAAGEHAADAQGTWRLRASSSAGQRAIIHCAALALA